MMGRGELLDGRVSRDTNNETDADGQDLEGSGSGSGDGGGGVEGTTTVTRTIPTRTCQSRAGPEKMVVVAAPTPYFSWDKCNDLAHVGERYRTEPINETKHAGVVTKV